MRLARWLLWIASILLAMVAAVAVLLRMHITGSLPQLEGELALTGLQSDVVIERDVQGIPTITSNNRNDTAFALGVLHAQERFFQMDLLRRNSAGELSALVGAAALEHDRQVRTHQFRKRAERAIASMEPGELQILQAYTRGVNAGLSALSSVPFEYDLLRVEPEPWVEADTVLTLYSMYLDLQPEWNEHERSLAVMRDVLPADWYQFLTPEGGMWDAPIQGAAIAWQAQLPQQPLAELQLSQQEMAKQQAAVYEPYREHITLGSNNWSIGGALTEYDGAIVANDMHLALREPNIWYRASWYAARDHRRITGATLPGTPALVVGSNQHIAWGFTNTYGDYHDSILLKVNADESEYLTPDGWQPFDKESEVIQIKDGDPVTVTVLLTRWGPVIGRDHHGNLLAMRWVAHDVEGANLNSVKLEGADDIYQALDIAATAGIPGQNFNVVDTQGNQGWTVAGRLPRRFGFGEAGVSPTLPADWSGGDIGWNGYLTPAEYPRVINPDNGRIWTANARVVSGELLDKVGRGDYVIGARQQQIEKDLLAREKFDEKQLLAIALDDRALFLQRWQQLLLYTLTDQVVADVPSLSELKQYVEQWQSRASKTSVGYLAVRRFREQVIDGTVGGVYRYIANKVKPVEEKKSTIDISAPSRVFWPNAVDNFVEYPVWTLVTQQPPQHVPAGFENWQTFMVAMAEATVAELTKDGKPLAEQTWGKANMLAIRHPLSGAVPFLSRWLDMPSEPMDGDTYMPRVQFPSSGASERMVVAPGHEENGIFHMATGQSAHPLSPYFSYGHRDWVEGNPSPFLPGETKWRLVLKPE